METWSESDLSKAIRFNITDASRTFALTVFVESEGTRPEDLNQDNMANVQGIFRWNGVYATWELFVRNRTNAPNANDRVESYNPNYTTVSISELFYNPEYYEGTKVRRYEGQGGDRACIPYILVFLLPQQFSQVRD